MLLMCCTQYASKFGKLISGPKTGKGQFSFESQRRAMPKNVHFHTIALISHASKVMLKILQASLQQYMNRELTDAQAGFGKGRGTRDQLLMFVGSWRKKGNFRKISTSASLSMQKPLTVWIKTTCGKFLKSWEYQTT